MKWIALHTSGHATVVESDTRFDATLDALQKLVGGRVECPPVLNPDWKFADVWANEEGLLVGLGLNTGASIICGHPIVGNAVLTGHDGMGGTVGVDVEKASALLGQYLDGQERNVEEALGWFTQLDGEIEP